MSYFHVLSERLREDAASFEGLAGKMNELGEELTGLSSGIFISSELAPVIRKTLDGIKGKITTGSDDVDRILKGLLGCIDLYENTEKSRQAPSCTPGYLDAIMNACGGKLLEEILQNKDSKYSASASVSAWKAEEKWKYGSAKVEVGSAEAHAKGKMQFNFVKNSNIPIPIPAPFINAEAGASVCALSASAKGEIGNALIGANGKVSAEIGSAEASASFKAQIFGKDGEFDPQVSAKAKAEAIAAEAKGSASGHILGVEGTVTGSVNLGVGAHAEVSLKEGVVKAEVGASLIAGASVGVEVDVSDGLEAIETLSGQIDDLFGSSKLTFVR